MSVVRIFNNGDEEQTVDSGSEAWCMDDVKEYVKTYMVYDLQIKDLQESRREWSADFIKEKSLPKKELATALSTAKKELDMDLVNEIYDNITSLVSE
tara:strand:- start:3183 stop:3473 length:291 start_codon:yes stop_codon:yes gene_type:complete